MKCKYVIIALGRKGTLEPEKNDPDLAIYQDEEYPEGYQQLKDDAKWEPVGLWVEVLGSKKALAGFRKSAKYKELLGNVAKGIVVQVAEPTASKGKKAPKKRKAAAKKQV